MATIVNARDVLLQATSPRINNYPIGNGTIDFGNVTGPTRPSNNADVTSTAVNSGVTVTNTSGGIVINGGGSIKGGQTAYDSGTGFFLGYSGAAYKFSIGNGTKKLTWDGSTLGIVGDITGSSNLDITGTANFDGTTMSGATAYTATFNLTGNARGGLVAVSGSSSTPGVVGLNNQSSGVAVSGIAGHLSSPSQVGVYGTAIYGKGVHGLSINGVGVYAESSSGNSLVIAGAGYMLWGSVVIASPPGGTSNFLRADGSWVAPPTYTPPFTPVQQGGGAGQLTNKIYIGWLGSQLGLQVDSTNFSGTWPIHINGNAGYATSAGSATTAGYAGIAGNSDQLDGYDSSAFIRLGGPTFTIVVPGVGTYPGCYVY